MRMGVGSEGRHGGVVGGRCAWTAFCDNHSFLCAKLSLSKQAKWGICEHFGVYQVSIGP